jgi:putative DNA primase/helicase
MTKQTMTGMNQRFVRHHQFTIKRAGARLPDGVLKTISEAKQVTGELKYQPSFNFVVRTVPVLLCNNVPSLADLSHGMLRRLMVIPFDRTFAEVDKDPE